MSPPHFSGLEVAEPAEPTSISGVAEFKQAIREEMNFSTRSERRFAVVAIGLGGVQDLSAEVLDDLQRRLRSTDAMGWLGTRELGVLLRDIEIDDAKRVAAALTAQLAHGVSATVYAFPPPPREAETQAPPAA